jgi:hypothetical protein
VVLKNLNLYVELCRIYHTKQSNHHQHFQHKNKESSLYNNKILSSLFTPLVVLADLFSAIDLYSLSPAFSAASK